MKRNKYLLAAMLLAACTGSPSGGGGGGDDGSGSSMGSGSGSDDPFQDTLNSRVVDYPSALRIAALKLTGHVPTLAEINGVALLSGDAQKQAYEAQIQTYMASPDFARQMFYFWRDTFKMGETPATDTAPALAAELSVTNGSYMNLFTQATNTCPTFDEGSAAFTDAVCTNGAPQTAGVLTNPGVMAQFFSNFGFRRQRWIQEIFDCTAYPAEVSATATTIDGAAAPYTGVWPFTSISSPTNGGGRVNFLDTSAIICANCHSTINHRAPLFANFDINGQYQSTISVPTPLEGAPPAMLTDYLPPGETTAWKYMVPAPDIATFGADMAADPGVAECGVARMWNWALGKTDIVDTLQTVPSATIQDEIAAFQADGFKLKDLIYAVYTSDDFVKF